MSFYWFILAQFDCDKNNDAYWIMLKSAPDTNRYWAMCVKILAHGNNWLIDSVQTNIDKQTHTLQIIIMY